MRQGLLGGMDHARNLAHLFFHFLQHFLAAARAVRIEADDDLRNVDPLGMFVQLGPTVGALFTLLLAESLRVTVGHDVHGLDGTIYGLLLVIFIIYMPKGILGTIRERWLPWLM